MTDFEDALFKAFDTGERQEREKVVEYLRLEAKRFRVQGQLRIAGELESIADGIERGVHWT